MQINERAAEWLERLDAMRNGCSEPLTIPHWMGAQAVALLDELATVCAATSEPHPSIAYIHAEVQRMAESADTPQAAVALRRVAGLLAGAVGGVPREAVERLRDAVSARKESYARRMDPPEDYSQLVATGRYRESNEILDEIEDILADTHDEPRDTQHGG